MREEKRRKKKKRQNQSEEIVEVAQMNRIHANVHIRWYGTHANGSQSITTVELP